MKCPACGVEMIEEDFGGVKVDVCKNGCKGIWFDWFELSRLDENSEGFGNAIDEALKTSRINDENRGPIKCPKCDIPMHIHKYQSSKEVNVDECYSCGGFFLDAGELKTIKQNFMNEKEKESYSQKLIDGIPEFKKAKENLEKEKARIEAIRKYTKYLSPRIKKDAK